MPARQSRIGVIENSVLVKIYALYALIFNCKIKFYGEKIPNAKRFLYKNIIIEKNNIGEYHAKWYEIQRYMVRDSEYIEKLDIESNFLLRLQCKVFKTEKVLSFYKQYFADLEYALLRDKFLMKNNPGGDCQLLLPKIGRAHV